MGYKLITKTKKQMGTSHTSPTIGAIQTPTFQELSASVNSFNSASYKASSSASKLSSIWDNINANHSSAAWPGLKLAGIFIESMNPTFDQAGDVFASGVFGHRQNISIPLELILRLPLLHQDQTTILVFGLKDVTTPLSDSHLLLNQRRALWSLQEWV